MIENFHLETSGEGCYSSDLLSAHLKIIIARFDFGK
jgi:hypothetical protein